MKEHQAQVALRLEAIATRVEAIASRLEAFGLKDFSKNTPMPAHPAAIFAGPPFVDVI